MKKFTAILIGLLVVLIAASLNADEKTNKDIKTSSESFKTKKVKPDKRVLVYENAAPFISACNWSKNTVNVEMEWDHGAFNSDTTNIPIFRLRPGYCTDYIGTDQAIWQNVRVTARQVNNKDNEASVRWLLHENTGTCSTDHVHQTKGYNEQCKADESHRMWSDVSGDWMNISTGWTIYICQDNNNLGAPCP